MYQSMTPLPSYADKMGFVLLFPTSKSQSGMNCWDAHTLKTTTPDGGSDSEGIAGMAKWALKTYNGDPKKVFVEGGSSGAMESNVMAATYPDVFAGAASYSGVPAGCWEGSPKSTPKSTKHNNPKKKKTNTNTKQQRNNQTRTKNPRKNRTQPKKKIVHG